MPPRKAPLSQEPLPVLVGAYVADLEHANRSPHTLKAYRLELARLAAFHPSPARTVTAEVLRAFLDTRAGLAPATRARTQGALASFFAWAYRHGYLDADPMGRVERVQVPDPEPRGLPRPEVERIFAQIPKSRLRDRLLFGLMAECGLRPGEALGLHVEDLDLRPDDEHLCVLGKGNRRRSVVLDDPRLVTLLRRYLRAAGYQHGPLFRAEKNGDGGPMRYQSIHVRWRQYCDAAGVACTLHQLRHSHATELVNDGVSLPTIRKRLGHKNIQTTLRYAEQSDTAADTELRRWRRRRARTGCPR